MATRPRSIVSICFSALIIIAVVAAHGCRTYAPVYPAVDTMPPAKAGPPVVLRPSCAPGQLNPGLNISFRINTYNHIEEIDRGSKKSDKPGQPIPNLHHRFGSGKIFDSGTNQTLACFIDGYIGLETPGTYEFKAFSNDGIRVSIDGQMVLEDPTKHGDRFSDVWSVVAPAPGTCPPGSRPGWHPFYAVYFQRVGSASIELYWKRPGDSDFSIVPPEAFGRL